MPDPIGRDRLPPGWPLVEALALGPTDVYRAVEDRDFNAKNVISLQELTDAVKAFSSGDGGTIVDLYA